MKSSRTSNSKKSLLSLLLVIAFLPGIAFGQICPKADVEVSAMAAKFAAAQTATVTAVHTMDPLIGLGLAARKAPIHVSVERPNKFHATHAAGDATRTVLYDGETLFVIHPGPGHHAEERLAAPTIERLGDLVFARFGFRPPLSDLLASDPRKELYREVTRVEHLGIDRVGWSRCHHIQMTQPGMLTDVWIDAKDHLPQKLLYTYTEISGSPEWKIRFRRWALDTPIDAGLFAQRPAANSQRVQMLKSR